MNKKNAPLPLSPQTSDMLHPHFDLDILVWKDEYSGRFRPPPDNYYDQFNEKWRLVLNDQLGEEGYNLGKGVQVDDNAISHLVHEWTGIWNADLSNEPRPVSRAITGTVPKSLIENKICIDAGCGMGRWTKVMQYIGAKDILSVDVSEHSLKSVKRFNKNILRANLSTLVKDNENLTEVFDFANLWGVAHHTHDPRETFMQVASTVKKGGAIYTMLYDVKGQHGTKLVNNYRKTFASFDNPEKKIEFVAAVAERRWHKDIPIVERLKNIRRNTLCLPKSPKIGVLDMMMPYYNWTVPVDVAIKWMKDAGFDNVEVLNPNSTQASRHYLASNKK
jgi:SAM-dependent methyltransferase